MFRIPANVWPTIDRAINAARRARNEGVPQQFHEQPTEYQVVRSRETKRYHVAAVRFGASEVRVRNVGQGETAAWRAFK